MTEASRGGKSGFAILSSMFASQEDARIAGYREALQSQPGKPGRDMVRIGDTSETKFIRSILKRDRPDAFVCANDLTAGDLMHTLISLGRPIPKDIRIVGIDDVKYARLLPVPLTTLHQPCRDLGRMALAIRAVLDRGKEYARHLSRDIVLAELFSRFLFVLFLRY